MSEKVSKAARKMVREVEDQREEILTAFVSKYGFHPDQCQQVQQGNSWFVVRLEPHIVAEVTRAIIVARLGGLSPWKRFCLWLARI